MQLSQYIPSFLLNPIFNSFKTMTMHLVFINLVCFILTLGGHILTDQLGCSFQKALKEMQIHRFLTSMFVHDGFSHLLCNMSSLIVNGMIVERNFGSTAMLVFYMGSGLIGGVLACIIHKLMDDNCISVGASGAICGLMGVTVMNTLLGFGLSGNILYVAIAVIPIIIIGFSKGADNICHFTSFFTGALMCMFLVWR